MLVGREVPDEKDVGQPGKVRRILRAADQKTLIGQRPRRLQKELLQSLLSVGGICTQVRQVGLKVLMTG